MYQLPLNHKISDFRTLRAGILVVVLVFAMVWNSQALPATKRSIVFEQVLKPDSATCVLPFTLAGKLILLRAKADGISGSFVLDTGAPGLVLNKTYFRQYATIDQTDETQVSVTGQGDVAQRARLKTFTLGSFVYYDADASLVSLAAIENLRGVKILGLLGLGLFSNCELIIDYRNKLIYLHFISKKEAKTYQHPMLNNVDAFNSYPFEIKSDRLVVNTSVADKKMKFVVDCAAENSLIDSRLPDKVLDSVQVNGRILVTGVGSKSIEAVSGVLSGLSLGALPFPGLPVIVTNLEKTCFGSLQCADGVLGYDFLAQQLVAFNFVKRTLYIFK